MTSNIIPFNPLDKKNLGASVAEAMLMGSVHPLKELPKFAGAGVYALYYLGDFPAYEEIASRNRAGKFMAPIYIGKAVPQGARRGGGVGDGAVGNSLYKRLNEHSKSIQQAENLDLAHFYCRFLVVDDIWIPLGESLLISRYAPLWNSLVDGFGNHTPGKGRYEGMVSRWDVLHPGRPWTTKCKPNTDSPQDILREVESYLRTAPFPTSNRFITPEP